MARRLGEAFWYGHIESWRGSGQTQVQYCATHGLNNKTFSRWHGRMRRGQGAGEAKLTLVPVGIAAALTHRPIQLYSPRGWRIELVGMAPGELATLLGQLP